MPPQGGWQQRAVKREASPPQGAGAKRARAMDGGHSFTAMLDDSFDPAAQAGRGRKHASLGNFAQYAHPAALAGHPQRGVLPALTRMDQYGQASYDQRSAGVLQEAVTGYVRSCSHCCFGRSWAGLRGGGADARARR